MGDLRDYNRDSLEKISLNEFYELRRKVEKKYLEDTKQKEIDLDICYDKKKRWTSPRSLNDLLNEKIFNHLDTLYQEKKPRGMSREEYLDVNGKTAVYYRFPVKWLREAGSRQGAKAGIRPHEIHQIVWPAYLGKYSSWQAYQNRKKEGVDLRKFKVYYYSYFNKEIKEFQLTLNLSEEIGQIKGWIDDENQDPNLEVNRIAYHDLNAVIDFAQEDGSWPFRLTVFIADDKPMTARNEYAGIIHGFDRYGDIISTYVICLVEGESNFDARQQITAKRLLHLLRGYLKLNAKTSDGNITSIGHLPIRGQMLNKFLHLAGRDWLIWGTYRSGEIFQSKLVVKDDLRAILLTAQSNEFSEQNVIIDISPLNEMIILNTFPSGGNQKGIICQWKIDGRSGLDIISGVFTHGGIINELSPYSGYLAMCALPDHKDNSHPLMEYNSTPIKSITIDQSFGELITQQPILSKLYNTLQKAVREHETEEFTLLNLPSFE
jgi:hypothetical protein